MYSILHYITNCLNFHSISTTKKKIRNNNKKNECTVESRKHTVNVYKNATFSLGLISWFNRECVIIKTCWNEAVEGIFQGFTCTLYLFGKEWKIFRSESSWGKWTTTTTYFGLLGFVCTTRWNVQGMLQVHFFTLKKMPLISWTSKKQTNKQKRGSDLQFKTNYFYKRQLSL